MMNVTNHAKSVNMTNFWLGIHYKNTEGTFVYASDNKPIEWSDWAPGQPGHNSNKETCVETLDNRKWSDLSCEGNERPIVCMRGSNH